MPQQLATGEGLHGGLFGHKGWAIPHRGGIAIGDEPRGAYDLPLLRLAAAGHRHGAPHDAQAPKSYMPMYTIPYYVYMTILYTVYCNTSSIRHLYAYTFLC